MDGISAISMGKISSRPRSIAKDKTIFEKGEYAVTVTFAVDDANYEIKGADDKGELVLEAILTIY